MIPYSGNERVLIPKTVYIKRQNINRLGNDRRNRGPTDTKAWKTKPAENQNPVKKSIGYDRGNGSKKGHPHFFNGAEQRAHGISQSYKGKTPAHYAQIGDPGLPYAFLVRVYPYDKFRRKNRQAAEDKTHGHHAGQRKAVRAANSIFVFRAPVLGEEYHPAVAKAKVSRKKKHGKKGTDPHCRNGDFPFAADHYGIYQTCGTYKKILKRDGKTYCQNVFIKLPVTGKGSFQDGSSI
jgi:hypothetical protein